MCKYSTVFLLKLPQKPNIRTHKISHIRNPISDHHKPIESKTESKSRIYIWIKSSFSYNIWVYESRSHEFDPTRMFADTTSCSITKRTREVYLDSWLNKREVPRSHTDIHLFAKYIREHRNDSEFEMTDPYSFVYYDSFHLIECVIMSGVDILISEHSSRDNCPNWCIFVPHDQILHTWCLSCEDISLSF